MDMGSDEKPIINLTMFMKVRYLLSITPFNNGVSGAHNWDIISCSLWKESSLLDTPPHFNRSVLICLANKLSNSALNLMDVFKTSNSLCIRYSYQSLECSSIKRMKYPYPYHV